MSTRASVRMGLPHRGVLVAALLAGVMAAGTAFAETDNATEDAKADTAQAATVEPFTVTGQFAGRLMASGPGRGPILPGGKAEIAAMGLKPGQKVSLRQSGVTLNDGKPYVADDKGGLSVSIDIPENAQTGLYPVVAETMDPPAATIFDVKVSPDLGTVGADKFDFESKRLTAGVYQVAEAPTLGALYVTAAVGRPPVSQSQLLKVDPKTMEIMAAVSPVKAPETDGKDAGVFAVYGVAVDQDKRQVWVTNTRQNTVAVYSADDLGLIKQFPVGLVPHPRDVVLKDGKAYVTSTFKPDLYVFDEASQKLLGTILLKSGKPRAEFATGSMSLSTDGQTLVVSSMETNEVALVDPDTSKVTAVYPVPGSIRTMGVAMDSVRQHVYAVGMGSDSLSILDAKTGDLLKSVPIGADPLNVAVDPKSGDVFTVVRSADAVAVTSADGQVISNLKIGSYPNHLVSDGAGGMFVVNKSKGPDDVTGDHITHITPASTQNASAGDATKTDDATSEDGVKKN